MIRVVLTGSECTGKTSLARRLADHYQAVWVPESSRDYAEAKGTPLDESDVEPIAALHVKTADRAQKLGSPLLILDTDLVSTVVYSNHYYQGCPTWIERAAVARLGDLYLLHHPDIPWIADGVRDRGDLRVEMHAQFRGALHSLSARSVDIHGTWDERLDQALAAIDPLLASR